MQVIWDVSQFEVQMRFCLNHDLGLGALAVELRVLEGESADHESQVLNYFVLGLWNLAFWDKRGVLIREVNHNTFT